jgi:hypothetical protein
VRDINLNNLLVGPSDMVSISGTAFYAADDGIHGMETPSGRRSQP